jgi:hypothetical protein
MQLGVGGQALRRQQGAGRHAAGGGAGHGK